MLLFCACLVADDLEVKPRRQRVNDAAGRPARLSIIVATPPSTLVKADVDDRAECRGRTKQAKQHVQAARHTHRLHEADRADEEETDNGEADHHVTFGSARGRDAPRLWGCVHRVWDALAAELRVIQRGSASCGCWWNCRCGRATADSRWTHRYFD